MTDFIKNLMYDKELVDIIKTAPDSNLLYQQLINGKITLQEYLAAVK